MTTQPQTRVLIVDDESEWRQKLVSIVSEHTDCETIVVKSFDEAERYVTSTEATSLHAAIIDVRLREQVYDQGGLTILNLLKERNADIPVLVLTAYSYDYPGLREITRRYPSVLAYDKDVFQEEAVTILNILVANLPPQIGDRPTKPRPTKRNGPPVPPEKTTPWRELLTGSLVILFVLAAAVLFFIMSSRFTQYPAQLNVVFGVMFIAIICVLLRIFTPSIVQNALGIYKELTSGKPSSPTSTTQESPDSDDADGSK